MEGANEAERHVHNTVGALAGVGQQLRDLAGRADAAAASVLRVSSAASLTPHEAPIDVSLYEAAGVQAGQLTKAYAGDPFREELAARRAARQEAKDAKRTEVLREAGLLKEGGGAGSPSKSLSRPQSREALSRPPSTASLGPIAEERGGVQRVVRQA